MDKLDEMFKHQYSLQEKLGNIKKFNESLSMKQQFINQMILAVHEEGVEIMKETAYKNPDYVPFGWKKGQGFNNDNFKKEIIDLQHFVLNLAIIAGMDSSEFSDLYLNKNKENFMRQDDGY